MRQVGKRGPVSGYSHSSCQASIKSYAAAVYGFCRHSSSSTTGCAAPCSISVICVYLLRRVYFIIQKCASSTVTWTNERTNRPFRSGLGEHFPTITITLCSLNWSRSRSNAHCIFCFRSTSNQPPTEVKKQQRRSEVDEVLLMLRLLLLLVNDDRRWWFDGVGGGSGVGRRMHWKKRGEGCWLRKEWSDHL